MNLNMQLNETSLVWKIEYDKHYEGEFTNLKHRYPNYYKKIIDFLTMNPNMVVRDRVFPLMGKKYRDAWEYKEELAEGTFRLYYKLITADRRVMIYYVGPKPAKPAKPPVPPPDFKSSSDIQTSSSQNDRRSAPKKGRTRRR